VIKTVAYFPLQAALNSTSVMGAVLDAVRKQGIKTKENSLDCDAVIIWSVLWYGRMSANQAVYEHYRSQGKPVIVIEVGALYRGNTWKISVNNVTRDGYYGHTHNLDPDRPRHLKISLAYQMQSKPHIVIAAQHKHSLQVSDLASMDQWVLDTIAQVKQHTDRPIHVRPHPRSRLHLPALPAGVTVEQPRLINGTYDSYDIHFDCHAVINHNSGPGIQAAIAGSRPLVHTSSLAYPVSVNIADIEKPYDTDREQWLIEICHTEYTPDELRAGTWLKRIEPALTAQ
jgi:hypothetical protein